MHPRTEAPVLLRLARKCRLLALHRVLRPLSIAAALAAPLLAPETLLAAPPILDLDEMTFVSSRGEHNDLVLRAEHARIDQRKQTAVLESVRASVPGSDEQQGFEMTCQRGELDLASDDFYAEGDVVGRTHSGREFKAPWVRYDHRKGLLFTEAPVQIREGGTTLRGVGFRYLIHERRFRLLGGATMVQEP